MTKMRPVFAQRITELRQQHEPKLSQYEAARRFGMSRGRLANYEQGRREPDFETVKQFAEFYNVTTDYLLRNGYQDFVKVGEKMTVINLSNVKTQNLITELENRSGITKIAVGPYQPYELKKKYNDDRQPIEAEIVLVVGHLDA